MGLQRGHPSSWQYGPDANSAYFRPSNAMHKNLFQKLISQKCTAVGRMLIVALFNSQKTNRTKIPNGVTPPMSLIVFTDVKDELLNERVQHGVMFTCMFLCAYLQKDIRDVSAGIWEQAGRQHIWVAWHSPASQLVPAKYLIIALLPFFPCHYQCLLSLIFLMIALLTSSSKVTLQSCFSFSWLDKFYLVFESIFPFLCLFQFVVELFQ